MPEKTDRELKAASPYSAVITREQFLLYEMRTTAKLVLEPALNRWRKNSPT